MTTSTRGNNVIAGLARSRSRGEETKPSFKTSELVVYVLAVIGVLIASAVTGDAGTDNGGGIFAPRQAPWVFPPLPPRPPVNPGPAQARPPRSATPPPTPGPTPPAPARPPA